MNAIDHVGLTATIAATGATRLAEWTEDRFGGRVTRIERLPRWRAGWFIDVEHDGSITHLYARGQRGPDWFTPFEFEHEAKVHQLLADHGIPVPRVHGIVDLGFTRALVMDRVRGEQGLASARDEQVRRRLLLHCVDYMAELHRIGADELAGRGFEVPQTEAAIVWSGAIARLEQNYLASIHGPDPVIEFLRRWLRRNLPAGRSTPAFVTWDSAQFLHEDGELTALVDFELAHVGDPYMDLAPLRTRDTLEPLGDLAAAFAHYERITGSPIHFDVLRYFEISQLTATLMLQRPVLAAPDRNSDLVTHMVWFVESARYAFDILGELLGVPLDGVEPIEAPASRRAAAYAHLVSSLHAAARAEVSDADAVAVWQRWRARCDYRLARHLQRVDQIGARVAAAELEDAGRVVGRVLHDEGEADAALTNLVQLEDADLDVPLLQYFNRRMQRTSMLLGPSDALLVRHITLQPLPDRDV